MGSNATCHVNTASQIHPKACGLPCVPRHFARIRLLRKFMQLLAAAYADSRFPSTKGYFGIFCPRVITKVIFRVELYKCTSISFRKLQLLSVNQGIWRQPGPVSPHPSILSGE